MFASLLPDLRADIEAIKRYISGSDAIRTLCQKPPLNHPVPPDVCPFQQSVTLYPSSLDWRIFDHCAAVTRLYAVYEEFATELLRAWLVGLPSIYPAYADLPVVVRKEHCVGVSKIMPRAGEGRYKHVSVETLVGGLNDGLAGKVPYSLPLEAFTLQEQNLRGEVLGTMFNRAGVPDTWGWIKKHPAVHEFEANVLGGAETAESQLATFVSYRNDAAHGDVGNLLDINSLKQLADFIALLCEILAQRLDAHQTAENVRNSAATVLGRVTEEYRNNVVVADTNGGRFSVGQSLIVVGSDYCFEATVTELQINGKNVQVAEYIREVGIKFDKLVKRNALLVR